MKAVYSWIKSVTLILFLNTCFHACYQLTEIRPCYRCDGALLNTSRVGNFCISSAGRIDGRCCLSNVNISDPERIIGLDLSNCSLTNVNDLEGAYKVVIIDISFNPIVNMSDTTFQGFRDLNYMILPQEIPCPGGNESWQRVEVEDRIRICEDQKNTCNQTGQLSMNCPENSLCAPYGPGFFECSCAKSFHGYKCLRKGEFPALKVFGPLAASTVVVSVLLWVTQRRKAKSL